MGASTSQPPPPQLATPASTALRVLCPCCNVLLVPPPGTTRFRCPCGALLQLQAPMATAADTATAAAAQPLNANSPFDERLRHLLSSSDPTAADVLFLQALVQRLPDAYAIASLQQQLGHAVRGTPPSLLDLLPTHSYTPPCSGTTPHVMSRTTCSVCLGDYTRGESLRSLPCFHAFHTECIDSWLKTSRSCPVCRASIDLSGVFTQ